MFLIFLFYLDKLGIIGDMAHLAGTIIYLVRVVFYFKVDTLSNFNCFLKEIEDERPIKIENSFLKHSVACNFPLKFCLSHGILLCSTYASSTGKNVTQNFPGQRKNRMLIGLSVSPCADQRTELN